MTTWSRRQFMQATAATGVAAAVRPRGVRGANERIRVALIGGGGRGSQLWPHFLRRADVDPVAVCDVYEPFRRRAAEAAGRPLAVEKDFRRVLDRRDVDAVIIAAPDHWHALQTDGFARILDVEQPTARDLAASRGNVMHEAARLRPVVIDESLTGLESLRLARDMGYNGVALKACKGQSQAMLMAAAARKYDMFVCVQDLTCAGASLIHSVGISAHVPAVAGIEANARQYVPAANKPWEDRFPGIFKISDGHMRPSGILGPGLGIPDDALPPRLAMPT